MLATGAPSLLRSSPVCGAAGRPVPGLASRVHQLLQTLAHLEEGDALFRDAHPRARLGVSPATRVAPADPEAPESPELYLLGPGEGARDAVEDRVDDQLRLFLGEVRQLGDLVHEVRLRHRGHAPPPRRPVGWPRPTVPGP